MVCMIAHYCMINFSLTIHNDLTAVNPKSIIITKNKPVINFPFTVNSSHIDCCAGGVCVGGGEGEGEEGGRREAVT